MCVFIVYVMEMYSYSVYIFFLVPLSFRGCSSLIQACPCVSSKTPRRIPVPVLDRPPLIYLLRVNEMQVYKGVFKVMSVHPSRVLQAEKKRLVLKKREQCDKTKDAVGRDPDLESAGRQEPKSSCGR